MFNPSTENARLWLKKYGQAFEKGPFVSYRHGNKTYRHVMQGEHPFQGPSLFESLTGLTYSVGPLHVQSDFTERLVEARGDFERTIREMYSVVSSLRDIGEGRKHGGSDGPLATAHIFFSNFASLFSKGSPEANLIDKAWKDYYTTIGAPEVVEQGKPSIVEQIINLFVSGVSDKKTEANSDAPLLARNSQVEESMELLREFIRSNEYPQDSLYHLYFAIHNVFRVAGESFGLNISDDLTGPGLGRIAFKFVRTNSQAEEREKIVELVNATNAAAGERIISNVEIIGNRVELVLADANPAKFLLLNPMDIYRSRGAEIDGIVPVSVMCLPESSDATETVLAALFGAGFNPRKANVDITKKDFAGSWVGTQITVEFCEKSIGAKGNAFSAEEFKERMRLAADALKMATDAGGVNIECTETGESFKAVIHGGFIQSKLGEEGSASIAYGNAAYQLRKLGLESGNPLLKPPVNQL